MVALSHPLPTVVPDPDGVDALIESFFAGGPYDLENGGFGRALGETDLILPLARQLGRLLGPAYPAPDGSTAAADLIAMGAVLLLSTAVNRLNLGEAFPGPTVFALIEEWEAMLGLQNGARLALADRQAQLLARHRTRFAGSPQAILRALAPLNGGTQPTMRETLARDSHANPKRVFTFTIRTIYDPNTPRSIGPLDEVVQIMKPAHTAVAYTSKSLTGGFRCNDPGSLTNNTVL